MKENNRTLKVEALTKIMKDGDAFERQDAYEQLFSEAMFYVNSLVSKYFNSYRVSWYEDLCQEGYVALCECLPHFDYTKAKSLTTYLKPFVMGRLTEYISAQAHNRSTYYAHIIRIVEEAEKELEEQSMPITPEAIQNITGLSITIITNAHNMRNTSQRCNLEAAEFTVSNLPTPEDRMIDMERNQTIYDILSILSDEERLEIECFYGFHEGGKGAKFAQEIMGLSFREQNTIHARALRKLRKLKSDEVLKDILGI